MFERARRKLTLRYIAVFTAVLTLFSVIFLVVIATVLAPNFDVAPEGAGAEGEALAYDVIIRRVAMALVLADLAILTVVGLAAWLLATSTLKPIADAHARQRRFVADASHEMRTPVAAIRSTAERGVLTSATPDEQREALRTILEASERLTRLTNDLLLLARTDERGGRRTERFDLSVAVAAAIEAERIARGGPAIGSVQLEPDLVVRGDEDEIGRLVGVLIENAVRHGGPLADVRIETRGDDREAIVAITDRGPGIAVPDLERIFEPFHRGERDADAVPGNGLGLAIAADLAKRNEARLGVDSAIGVGSTFRVAMTRFR